MKKIRRMFMTTALALACLSGQADAIGLGRSDGLKPQASAQQTASYFGSILASIEGWLHALIGLDSTDR